MTITDPYARLVDRWGRPVATALWLAGWLIVLLTITVAVGTVLVAFGGVEETPWDVATLDAFTRGRSPGRSRFWTLATHLGASAVLVPFLLAVGVSAWARTREPFALQLLGGAYLGGALLYNVAKLVVGRPRPAAELALGAESGLAFPSGHATNAAAVGTAVVVLVLATVGARLLRVLTVLAVGVVVVLVAVSRLYLGAHWVTDVVGGTVLGATWAWVLGTTLTSRAGPFPRDATSPGTGPGLGR